MMPAAFYRQPAERLAPALIGCTLLVDGVGGMIVETEAYARDDPASHSFAGPTARNRAMFGPPGHAYVYLSYGLHWCLNIVCGEDPGQAVLVRALEPTQGLDAMRARRRGAADRLLCAGPGRLGQALAVDRGHDGRPLDQPPFTVEPVSMPVAVVEAPRIGISRGQDRLWRFALDGSHYLSRAFPKS